MKSDQSGKPWKNIKRNRRPKAGDIVAAELRRRIVEGVLAEDDHLPEEAELEEIFGVSRPTIRQALRILEWEGLIAIRHGARGGATVRRPTLEIAARYTGLVLQSLGTRVSDVFDTRILLEPAVVRSLAERSSPEDVQALRGVLKAEEEHYDYIRTPENFRLMLIELSRNITSKVLLGVLSEIIQRQSDNLNVVVPLNDRERWRYIGQKMRWQLVEHIEAGEKDEAEALWREYVSAWTRILGVHLADAPVDVLE